MDDEPMFEVGDEFELIAPFTCSGDEPSEDEDFDLELRGNDGYIPTGVLIEDDTTEWLMIQWRTYDGKSIDLWTDRHVVKLVADTDVTDEEVDAAIQSILGTTAEHAILTDV